MGSSTTTESSINLRPQGSLEGQLAGGGAPVDTTDIDKKIAGQKQAIRLGMGGDMEAQKAGLKRLEDERAQMIQAGQNSGQAGTNGQISQDLQSFRDIINAGPNVNDVSAGVQAQRDLAAMFQQAAQTSGLPTEQDIGNASNIAGNLFQAQRTAMEQAFSDQSRDASRRAAIQGRSLSDPILAAKLAQEQTRQGASLESQQGATAQQLALQLPGQRLQLASQGANLLGGLGQQAAANRLALQGLGRQALMDERNFRLQTAGRTTTQTTSPGLGSILGGIAGGIGGIAGSVPGLSSIFGGSNTKIPGANEYIQGSPITNLSSSDKSFLGIN